MRFRDDGGASTWRPALQRFRDEFNRIDRSVQTDAVGTTSGALGGGPMKSDTYDLVVLGAGSAARDGAGKASREYGASVALIERTRWGGSCPNVACRPTKAYLVAAELMHDVRRHAAERGIITGPARVDLARVRTWKDSLRRSQESWLEVLTNAGY